MEELLLRTEKKIINNLNQNCITCEMFHLGLSEND